MALFKILKGKASGLSAKPAVEGYCYFTTDDGKFYIDIASASKATIGTNRICLNAAKADLALKADKLTTARTIALSGSVTGSASFDGSNNITIATTTNHTHSYAGSSSAGGSANSAVKLQTARKITIAGGAASGSTSLSFDGSSDQSIALPFVYASYLSWGGRNTVADISPLDAAMSYLHNANKAQFSNPAGITVEYSRDNGATWTDYGATNSQKVNFVSGLGAYFALGGPSASGNTTTSDQLRITIQPDKCGFYTSLKTILINILTNGNSDCKVKIERSSRGSDTNFTQVIGTYAISGWSGWNSIPLNIGAFGGDSTQTGNTGALRFTFTHMTVSSSKKATNILDMMFLGTTSWQYNSNMAKTGHIYNWDYRQNAIFPAQITATAFNGKASSASVIADEAGVNTSLNKLSTETSTPVDTDYYISQYVNGGTTTTTYHRRPMSALWAYVKGKTDGLYQSKGNYAGSGSAGGSANSAVKLDTSTAGASTQPVYFTGGKPVACTYTLGKSVPSDAKFTDTVYTLPTAGSALGGVKTTSTVTSASGYTACPIIDGVPYYKDTNTTYSLSSFGVNASAAELNYTKGVTSAIQTQLNGKVPTSRTVNGKALSADISLTASDVGAAASGHTHSYLPLTGGTVSGATTFSNTTASTSTTTGAVKISGGLGVAGSIYGSKVYGAVWNDYAEYRICNEEFLPGQVVCENGDDTLSISAQRLQPGANIVSDTFGFAIGETDEAKCPVAVSGRVLAYPAEPLSSYLPGDPVCAGPRGTVSKMTREEVREYPDRIIGTVSTVPTYETWGENNVPVNGRIWIKVK